MPLCDTASSMTINAQHVQMPATFALAASLTWRDQVPGQAAVHIILEQVCIHEGSAYAAWQGLPWEGPLLHLAAQEPSYGRAHIAAADQGATGCYSWVPPDLRLQVLKVLLRHQMLPARAGLISGAQTLRLAACLGAWATTGSCGSSIVKGSS